MQIQELQENILQQTETKHAPVALERPMSKPPERTAFPDEFCAAQQAQEEELRQRLTRKVKLEKISRERQENIEMERQENILREIEAKRPPVAEEAS